MKEIWKPIRNYEGLYEVSNFGNVRSLTRKTTGNRNRNLAGKPMNISITTTGYPKVELCKDGVSKSLKVHRLVADAFIPVVSGKTVINHKDNDPFNNHVLNLEWCTQKENVQHGYDIGAHKCVRIITKEQSEFISSFYIPYSRENNMRVLSNILGVKEATIRYEISHPRSGRNYLEVL